MEVPPLNEVVDTSEGDTERKKREDEENFLLAADTYIVPGDLEEDNINSVLDVSGTISLYSFFFFLGGGGGGGGVS